jgi:tetratricopeptide (TPR) repeat protein
MTETNSRVLLIVVSLVIAAILAEGAVRLVFWVRDVHSTDAVYAELKDKYRAAGASGETFNIYYFGGSTMEGEPYNPSVSVPKLLAYMFDNRLRGKPIRNVNLAASSMDIQYNLIRMQKIVEHSTEFQPSLFVVYSGHNEYLKFTELYLSPLAMALASYSKLAGLLVRALDRDDLTIDDRRLFDEPLMNDKRFDSVFDAYTQSITSMVDTARSADIPILVATVAGNYAEWQPSRSSSCSREEDHAELKRLIEAAMEAEQGGDQRMGAEYYAVAENICPGFAEAIYRRGILYRQLGEHAEAWELFQKAVDNDGVPLRASTRQNDFIRGLRADGNRIVVDVVRGLRNRATDGLIGYDLMIDAHHPNLSGYLEMTKLFARGIHDHFGVTRDLREPELAEVTEIFGIDESVRFDVLISRGRWMTRIATWRYDAAERFARAGGNFIMASRLNPDSYKPDLGLAVIAFLQKDLAQAEAHLARARQKDAPAVDSYLEIPWIRKVTARAYKS